MTNGKRESYHNPTITWVGSLAQAFTSFSRNPLDPSTPILPYLSSASNYSRISRYADTKLFVAMFVREMAKHLPAPPGAGCHELPQERGIVVNCLCPGTVNTAADNNLPFWLRIPMNLNRKLRARTVQEGSRTLIYAAEVAGPESHGRYIANNVISPYVYSLIPLLLTMHFKNWV
jgi:NAD(P)-dependent dehydrogenase (short-subunit alcohol dehydrogenase family)